MNKVCLCCGKTLDKKEKQPWHVKCIKGFFGMTALPEISLDEKMIENYVFSMLESRVTVTGVQKKFSLNFDESKKDRLTLVNYPAGYILKPPSDEYGDLPELEFCVMHLAKMTGIAVVPNGLVEGNFITKRIDRKNGGKLAMEDFCQLSERLTSEKYKGSYESCGKIIKSYSDMPGVDMADFFLRIVFSFVTGNSDMHYKNFSLIENEQGSGKYRLSAAYDLLPVNLVLPEDDEECALTLNGKKSKLKYEDFVAFGENCGLANKTIAGLVKKVCELEEDYCTMIDLMPLKKKKKDGLKSLIHHRINRLKG